MSSPLPDLGLKERVLLWLAHLDGRDDPGLAATQAGISNATSLSRGHVSRTVAPLVDRGLVEAHMARVSGFSRRLKAYRITDAGRAEVERIERSLAAFEVDVRRGAGDPVRMRLDVLLQRDDLDLWEVLGRLQDHGAVDLEPARNQAPQARFVRDLADAPRDTGFVGREKELDAVARWLDRDVPLAVVEGPGGVGKSSLASHAVHTLVAQRHALWVRVSEWMTREGLFDWLDGFLARLGRPAPAALQGAERTLDVIRRLRGMPVLVVLDDVQKATPHLREAMVRLVRGCAAAPATRFLFIGRTVSLPPDLSRTATVLRLLPLSDAVAERILSDRGVPQPLRHPMVEQAQGNALFLTLLARASASEVEVAARADLQRWLTDDLASDLPGDHREVLRWAAALRAPFGPRLFERLGVGSPAAFANLADASLLTAREDGRFEMHDLVRDAFYDRLGFAERRQVHARLAETFRPRGDDFGEATEFLHHLVQSGQRDDAVRWVLRNQGRIMARAHELFRADRAEADESTVAGAKRRGSVGSGSTTALRGG